MYDLVASFHSQWSDTMDPKPTLFDCDLCPIYEERTKLNFGLPCSLAPKEQQEQWSECCQIQNISWVELGGIYEDILLASLQVPN